MPAVFSTAQVEAIRGELSAAFAADGGGATLRAASGELYGSRNILQLWPGVADVWRSPPLPEVLARILGDEFGLVRVLFFDKPPGQSWALPWHKDFAVAVRDNRLPSSHFHKPTRKAGVPHVEAPQCLLEKMLTLRIHLNDICEENGPLKVIPGSHLGREDRPPRTILARAGDVLLMRPLISHASNKSHPETTRHRRILHLEFAGTPELPDGYAWHDFVRSG